MRPQREGGGIRRRIRSKVQRQGQPGGGELNLRQERTKRAPRQALHQRAILIDEGCEEGFRLRAQGEGLVGGIHFVETLDQAEVGFSDLRGDIGLRPASRPIRRHRLEQPCDEARGYVLLLQARL